MSRTHSTFRLSAETKELLRTLASADDATLTAEVTRLIRDEAKRRGVPPPRVANPGTKTTDRTEPEEPLK